MRLLLFNGNRLTRLTLPKKIEGSFWLIDELNKNNNIINIEAKNGKWIMKENDEAKIIFGNSYTSEIELMPNYFYFIDYEGKKMFLYSERVLDKTIRYYKIQQNTTLTLGKDATQDIMYENAYIINNYLNLTFTNEGWNINIQPSSNVYLNNSLLLTLNKKLNYGDTLFVLGVRITLYNGMISINNPYNFVRINTNKLTETSFDSDLNVEKKVPESEQIKEIDFYTDDDYFFKKPRLRRFIEEYELIMSQPPKKQEKQEMPMILVLGPTLTMGVVSIVTLSNVLIRVFSGQQPIGRAIPTLISSVAMLISSIVWPNLTKRYQKRLEKKKEKERVEKYKKYIELKKKELYDVYIDQTQMLKENLISVEDCENIILKKKRNLWERRTDQQDFLTVRVGMGDVPLQLKVNFNKEDFVIETDELKKEAEEALDSYKTIKNVPVGYSFYNKNVTAIMGNDNEVFPFVDNLILQMLAFHSFDDLKIVFLVSKKNLGMWEKYKEIPHVFSNNKQVRFFATDIEDIKYINSFLEQEYFNRITDQTDSMVVNENREKNFSPYYLIITDNYPMIRKIGIIERILNNKENYGFSLAVVENKLGKLPSACVNFISTVGNAAILSTSKDDYYQQPFNKEINNNLNITECCKILSNIPIEFTEDIRNLPTHLGFLEMFNVGKVEQLNALNRWRINNPIKSLRAQVGINDESNPIYLDLHEKYHGPHGLIAGTTGSGKSEFIITYILSMIVNYSPEEVAFILIDYKGGGLAGAFENKTLGYRLPHLAGTITNLDKASLNRTLVSIDSELKRRQKVFNEVRDKLGESTIDIYKYQRFFREGKINEPMPHLFIISDEFAELKAQQPEFMADLISAARIGRSLGVHLILATQKPSGVVNDQIWSNTKFRVCLKVQDKSDSNEMLKRPDAADITNAGRFFLQVGNDEIFVLGQSGWAGTQYAATDSVKKKYDRSVSVIDEVGNVIKNLEETKENTNVNKDNGDELTNIMKYICSLADKENLKAKNLWLDSIPAEIYVDDVITKYRYNNSNVVTAVIGEYDEPSKQKQDILTLPFDEDGNTIVYGASGTNREMFVSTVIYSLCTTYVSEDINIYVVDCGSESLRVYSNFPQVGDIVYSQENDKLVKLITLLSEEVAYRKKLFADYNGEYKNYIKNSGKKIPLKIIIINNYDNFKENHESLEETLIRISREGKRYGILFLITASSPRIIFSRLQRNFNRIFALDMQSRSDYMEVLGKIGNVYPSDFDGRGLYRNEEVCEFQTAQIASFDNLVEFVKNKVELVKKHCKTHAPNIPSLPEEVTIDILDKEINNINNLPIGIKKGNLKTCFYNFFNDKVTIISSKNVKYCEKLLETIIYGVRKLGNMVVLIDTEQIFESLGGTVNNYADANFEEFILKFEAFLDKEIDGREIKVLCIIVGLEKFRQSMNDNKFKGFFNGIKTLPNLNLAFVDSSFKLKKVCFEPWYSGVTNNSNGIWVGPGFMEQTVINTSDYKNKLRDQINHQFAWVTINGESQLVKIVGEKEFKDEE